VATDILGENPKETIEVSLNAIKEHLWKGKVVKISPFRGTKDMEKKTIVGLMFIVAVVAVLIFAGCVEKSSYQKPTYELKVSVIFDPPPKTEFLTEVEIGGWGIKEERQGVRLGDAVFHLSRGKYPVCIERESGGEMYNLYEKYEFVQWADGDTKFCPREVNLEQDVHLTAIYKLLYRFTISPYEVTPNTPVKFEVLTTVPRKVCIYSDILNDEGFLISKEPIAIIEKGQDGLYSTQWIPQRCGCMRFHAEIGNEKTEMGYLTVGDRVVPKITIEPEVAKLDEPVTISVSISRGVEGRIEVKYYVNGSWKGNLASYIDRREVSFTWVPPAPGIYTIKARNYPSGEFACKYIGGTSEAELIVQ